MTERMRLDDGVERHVRAYFASIAHLRHLGVVLHALRPGFCEMRMRIRPEHTQQHGYLHGGIIGTIADSACGHAALTLLPAGADVVTVEYKLNFLAPARGGQLNVRAEVLNPLPGGRTLTVGEAHAYVVRDGSETRCASALVTYLTLG